MLIKCLPFNNVVATGLATVNLQNLLGYTVDRIILVLGGTFTKAMITGIQVKANSKVIVDSTGSRMDSRMKYRGIFDDSTHLSIDFSEIRSKTIVGQKLGSLDTTFGISQLSAEINIAGATSPTLEAYAEVSAPQIDQQTRGLIGKVLNYTANFGAAGTFPLPIPYGSQGGALIKRVHLHGSTVTGALVKKNGIVIHESVAALNSFNLQEYQRVPQSNIYTLDFVKDGNQSNALNAANATTMEWYATVSGSGNVVVEAELLDPLANN